MICWVSAPSYFKILGPLGTGYSHKCFLLVFVFQKVLGAKFSSLVHVTAQHPPGELPLWPWADQSYYCGLGQLLEPDR